MSRPALADVDLNLLVALDLLLKESSVTRAAARLGITQSAMSRTLNRLRALFDDPLLVRRGAELTPTALASQLAPKIADVLASVGQILAAPRQFDPARALRRFSLLASDYAQAVLVPALLERVREAAPNVDLVVRATREPERMLANRDAALMVGPARADVSTLMRQLLFKDRLVCVARHRNPAIARELSLERYTQAQHVLVSPRGLQGGLVDDALRARGLERRVLLEVPHFLAAALVVAGSDLLLTVPERLAEVAAPRFDLRVAPLPLDVAPIEFLQLWHPRDQDDAAHVWLRAQVAAAARVAIT